MFDFSDNLFLKRVLFFLALLLAFSIALPIRVNAIVTVSLFSVFALLTWFSSGVTKQNILSPIFLLISILIMILLIGLVHTSEIKNGISDMERSFFMIAFLTTIYRFENLGITVFHLIWAFTVGCFGVTFYGLSYALMFLSSDEYRQVLTLGHTYFADIILVHPTYLSAYFIFIFFFLMETLRTRRTILSIFSTTGIGVAAIFIIAILFLLRAQTGLITFGMLFVIYAIIILKRRAWLVTFLLFTVSLLVFLLDSSRVATFFDTYGKNVSSALDQRFSVWRGTIEGIKTAPFFGAGTGGEQQLINKGYAITGYQEGIDNSYNAHNQYLQFLARNGIPELLCFLALLFYSFRQSLKMPNYTFLMFNMAVTLIMFTESFLDVQRGIVFFYFFLCAFIYLPYESTPQPIKSV